MLIDNYLEEIQNSKKPSVTQTVEFAITKSIELYKTVLNKERSKCRTIKDKDQNKMCMLQAKLTAFGQQEKLLDQYYDRICYKTNEPQKCRKILATYWNKKEDGIKKKTKNNKWELENEITRKSREKNDKKEVLNIVTSLMNKYWLTHIKELEKEKKKSLKYITKLEDKKYVENLDLSKTIPKSLINQLRLISEQKDQDDIIYIFTNYEAGKKFELPEKIKLGNNKFMLITLKVNLQYDTGLNKFIIGKIESIVKINRSVSNQKDQKPTIAIFDGITYIGSKEHNNNWVRRVKTSKF